MSAHASFMPRTTIVRLIARVLIAGPLLVASSTMAPATFASTLTPPPPAGAECHDGGPGTICSWTEHFATPFPVPYGVACDGFTVKVHLSGERRVTAFYDDSGALDRKIRHGTFSGTLRNSVTGATVPHEGHFTIVDDVADGTSTITGMLSRTVLPHDGVIWRNIGRIVLSLQNGSVLFEAGEHGTWDVLGDPDVASRLCAALG